MKLSCESCTLVNSIQAELFTILENRNEKWDQRYSAVNGVGEPARVLADFPHLLPSDGVVLDLACGLGANALFLAQQGLVVHAWDTSQVALEKLQSIAAHQRLKIHTQQRNCEKHPPESESLDVLVVSQFLYRPILKSLAESLRPGGLLYYETHTIERPDHLNGPSNPDYLLRSGELLDVFSQFCVHAYREDGLTGDVQKGYRGKASIVARKP